MSVSEHKAHAHGGREPWNVIVVKRAFHTRGTPIEHVTPTVECDASRTGLYTANKNMKPTTPTREREDPMPSLAPFVVLLVTSVVLGAAMVQIARLIWL